jgi:phosphoglycolate phosphatase-like HAD superfamily hydrolase
MNGPNSSTRYFEPLLGVVFDLDGTLVESQHDFPRMRRGVVRLAEAHGVVPGHLSIRETIPRLMEAARSEIERSGSPEGVLYRFDAEVNKAIDAIEMESLPRTVPRSGAVELLRTLFARGFRNGVLTRSSDAFCRSALLKTGLIDYFPYLRTRSAPGPSKPSPEALLLLLKEMGVPPDRAVYIGDHLLDVECATRAHVRFYGLLPEKPNADSMTADRFRATGAQDVVANLSELAQLLGVGRPRMDRPTPAT